MGGWYERLGEGAAEAVRQFFETQPPEVLAMISSCCDPNDFSWYEGLMAAWDSGKFRDERLFWSVGVHPYMAEDYETWSAGDGKILERMLALASHPRCLAVGECGLDYCKKWDSYEAQRRVFAQVCQIAVRLKKPLVVHARDAPRDTLEILRSNIPSDWPVHVHGYTGEVADMLELLESFSGLCVGLCGAITYYQFHSACSRCAPLFTPGCRFCGDNPNGVARDLGALTRALPLDRLLLETDAPYMTPIPYRSFGVKCLPWMISCTAESIANTKGVGVAEVIAASNRNARRLYSLGTLPGTTDSLTICDDA